MAVILFILILLVLILVHEFGHFIIAKKSGIRVDEFGIGFPPKAKSLGVKNGTEYTLNWLPFGGFVRIFGETPTEESINGPDSARSFINKPKYIQAAVLVGGVFFNMLLAWALLSLMFMVGTDIALTEEERSIATDVRLVISSVLPESPAGDIGLVAGDYIIGMKSGDESLEILTPEEALTFISTHSDGPIDVAIKRDSVIDRYSITPEKNIVLDDPDRAVLGISMGSVGFLRYSNPLTALKEGAKFTIDLTKLVWGGISGLFLSIFALSADFSDVAGPIGIVSVVGDAAQVGFASILFLTAIISINLAIINILPIPALDGGRLLFLVIETIAGRRIKPEVANTVHAVFFGLLILLIVVVSYFDVVRLFQ